MNIGDIVMNTPRHDPVWAVTGEVVTIVKKVIEVRIIRSVRRSDGSVAETSDPWRGTGYVIRSAAFLWSNE